MSREEWWLDYVEDELDAETRKEMKALLRHSRKDQGIVKSLSDTKCLVRQASKKIPPLPEERLIDLHDRIMAGVESAQLREKPQPRLERISKKVSNQSPSFRLRGG